MFCCNFLRGISGLHNLWIIDRFDLLSRVKCPLETTLKGMFLHTNPLSVMSEARVVYLSYFLVLADRIMPACSKQIVSSKKYTVVTWVHKDKAGMELVRIMS